MRNLVVNAVDTIVGKEVDGVVMPRPRLSVALPKWAAAQVGGAASEGAVLEAVLEEAVKTEETPKAPVDGTGGLAATFARVLASSTQKEQKAAAMTTECR